jgi:hypothetical protein
MTIILRLTAFFIVTVFALRANAQPASAHKEDSLQLLPSNYLDKVSSRANRLEQMLDKKTDKALQQMMRLEEGIKKRLDSLKAKEIFGDAEQKYKELEQRLQGKLSSPYIAALDTAITSLKFLQQNPQLVLQVKDGQLKLKDALSNVKGLENQFQKAEEIKKFLKERKDFLRNQLSQLGFAKELKKISKTSYYFFQHLSEAKELAKDHRKAERKAIDLLSRTKIFKDFMQKNSQ